MPLFGSKHNHNDNMETTTGGGRHHHMNPDNGVGTNNYPAATTGTGMGPGSNQTYPASQQGQGMMTGQQGLGQQGLGGSDNMTHGHHGHGATGAAGGGFDNETGYGTGGAGGMGTGGMGAGGMGQSGMGQGGMGQGGMGSGIPPTGAVNHTSSGGTGQRITGKIESAIGSLVGSSALKAKGLQKEQEANAVKLQGHELAEAERLEREAMMRRERAVGHGAHPANSQLGAGHTGTGHLGTGPGGTGAGGPGAGYN